MDLQRKCWGRMHDRGGGGDRQQRHQHQQQQQQHQQRGEDTPPRPARKNSAPRVVRKTPPPPPKARQTKPKAKPKGNGKGKGKATPSPPLARQGPGPLLERARYVPWAEGGKGGTVNQVTVLADWDEELDPGECWVVSQGPNGEGGKKGKKRKRESERGTCWVPGKLLFRTREKAEAHLRKALWEGVNGDDGDVGDDEGVEGGE